MKRIFFLLLVFLIGCGGGGDSSPAVTDTPASNSDSLAGGTTWQDIFENTKEKTVIVSSLYSDGSTVNGSGFFVKPGVVVTNHHVVAPSIGYSKLDCVDIIMSNADEWQVIGIDASLKNRDIAFLQIEQQNQTPVRLGTFASLSVLDEIMHIGNPLSLNWTANKGSVSAIRTAGEVSGLDGVLSDTSIVQHDISSDRGSSGGVILNQSGEAVAVLFAGLGQASGEFRFGISIDYVTSGLNNLSFTPIEASVPTTQEPSGNTPSLNYQKTALLQGSWYLYYYLISMWDDYFHFSTIEESKSTPGDYIISGTGFYGNIVLGGYSSQYDTWSIYQPLSTINQLFIFQTDGNNIINGCYFQISKSTGDMSPCYGLYGYKTGVASSSQKTGLAKQEENLAKQEEKFEQAESGPFNEDVFNQYQKMRDAFAKP